MVYCFIVSVAVELGIEWEFIVGHFVVLVALYVGQNDTACHGLNGFDDSVNDVPIGLESRIGEAIGVLEGTLDTTEKWIVVAAELDLDRGIDATEPKEVVKKAGNG